MSIDLGGAKGADEWVFTNHICLVTETVRHFLKPG